MQPNNMPLVAILMCTYKAAKYLKPQMDSFYAQTHSNWELWVSDDGSPDNTVSLLEEYKADARHTVHLCEGPRKGFAHNFLSLLEKAETSAEYYAFSDQDDVWNADKVERAVNWIKTIPEDVPALYCSRTELTDGELVPTGYSPLFPKPPGLKNALTQNIAGGNTMVINRAARDIIMAAGEVDVPYHDWWVYLAVTAAGGVAHYDPTSTLLYRQHASNVVGCSVGIRPRILRFFKLLEGQNQDWITQNLIALKPIYSRLPAESQALVDKFTEARKASFFKRIYMVSRLGLYRQTDVGSVALIISVIFGKL